MYQLLESILSFMTRSSKGVTGGFKAVGTVAADITLPQPSWVQNRGADGQTLAYEDEYGNSGSITMKENEITPSRIAKIKNGSGASMYLIFSK